MISLCTLIFQDYSINHGLKKEFLDPQFFLKCSSVGRASEPRRRGLWIKTCTAHLDRSREKARYMTTSTKSPLHANRDSGVDRWRSQRDTKHGTVGFWIKQQGRWGRMSTMTKSTKPI